MKIDPSLGYWIARRYGKETPGKAQTVALTRPTDHIVDSSADVTLCGVRYPSDFATPWEKVGGSLPEGLDRVKDPALFLTHNPNLCGNCRRVILAITAGGR